jgi:hypothetical protein
MDFRRKMNKKFHRNAFTCLLTFLLVLTLNACAAQPKEVVVSAAQPTATLEPIVTASPVSPSPSPTPDSTDAQRDYSHVLSRSLGYIPGVGLVDPNAPLRVLAEPVSQARDGITVTVKEAVLSPDKTIVVFSFENNSVNEVSKATADCQIDAEIHLPGDEPLQALNGRGDEIGAIWEYHLLYAPIPSDTNSFTLFAKCILVDGTVYPENWELSLKFIPAPPDMTVLPVIEYEPSQRPEMTSGTKTNPITLTNVIDTGTSYILIGKHASIRTSTGYPVNYSFWVMDGSGKTLPWNIPSDVVLPPSSSSDSEDWIVEVDKGLVPPLTVRYSVHSSYPALTDAPLEFEFDAGENPQLGDTWQLNKEFNAGGHFFTLKTIGVDESSVIFSNNPSLLEETIKKEGQHPFDGYDFSFEWLDESISEVTVDISGYTSVGCNLGNRAVKGETSFSFLGFPELPKGKLKIVFSVELRDLQKWSLQWQPE